MRRRTRQDAEGVIDSQKAIAALLRNTRTKVRPLSLIEVERWLAVAIRQVGSLGEVARLIGLSPKMLGQFQCVNKLSAPVRDLFRLRRIDSVDAATHLSKISSTAQLPVALEVANGAMNTSDVRAVAEILTRKPDMAADAAIRDVKATRNVVHHIAEFAIRGANIRKKVLRRRFESALGAQNLISLSEQEGIGRVVLTPDGRRALMQMCKTRGMTKARAITVIAEGDATL